jgi:hypothetical protein
MARISTYGIDAKPELGDKVIGTDANPSAGLATKNYSIADIAALINHTNSLAVADQAIFLFQDDLDEGRDSGTISFDAGGGIGTSFASITSIVVSKQAAGGKNVANYLPLFLNKDIILADTTSVNNFGTYKVTSITTHPTETAFWVVTLQNYYSNSAIAENGHYIFSEFVNPASDAADKHYTHNQSVAAVTWTVAHNLDKFPSVTVALSTGQQGFGDVTFIDENNLTITFAGAESGKAYMN